MGTQGGCLSWASVSSPGGVDGDPGNGIGPLRPGEWEEGEGPAAPLEFRRDLEASPSWSQLPPSPASWRPPRPGSP